MKRVAIVGATGYTGAELTAILYRHPGVELVGLYSSTGGSGGEIVPAPGGQARVPVLHGEPFELEKLLAAKPDVVFLATPKIRAAIRRRSSSRCGRSRTCSTATSR